MPHTTPDDTALDFAAREHADQARRSVVQPDPLADDTAISFATVASAASPRSQTSELVQQTWSEADTANWRRAPR